jgi:integrase/recombinase XerD
VCGEGGLAVGAGDLRVARSAGPGGGVDVRVGVPLADVYLEFLGGRCRPNTVLAAAYDLKVFFSVVARRPGQVQPADVLAFITAQRTGRAGGHGVLQPVLAGNEPVGVSAATVRRRLSIVSGFFAFLQARGDVAANPVPRGLPTRRERSRPRQGVPLVRATRQLPRILSPAEVDALTAALRTHRDQAMVAAMVLGGLRRCEVLGLSLDDLHVAERRVFVAEGKAGRQRLVREAVAGGRLGSKTGSKRVAILGHPWRHGATEAAGRTTSSHIPLLAWLVWHARGQGFESP